MQSTAKDVMTYREEVPAERREALTRLRELCRTLLTDFYSKPERIDFDVVESILRATQKSTGPVC